MGKGKSTDNLVKFLCSPAEKADEDLAISFFRDLFGTKFTRQKEAERSDGYVAGNLVLELKGSNADWLSGLLQGLAYSKELDFTKVVVATHEFLAVWYISDIPEDVSDAVYAAKGAPNEIGKKLASKFKSKKKTILESASYYLNPDYLPTSRSMFRLSKDELVSSIDRFIEVLKSPVRKRQRITLKNFTAVLKKMVPFFDEKHPLAAVRAFYSIIFGWDEGSKVELSDRKPDAASVRGETVTNLKPDRRDEFKRFVEDHYVSDDKISSKDVFFARFDEALDAVDKEFRIKHGIFFTDLDLSRFAMWYVKRELGDIGKNYLVIDPACGSGNLVTNWRSPLELRHKVVSEIEPELLFAVERRMQGDEWHNGKFTVVPKVAEAKGLNFLDKSAEEYVNILKGYLKEKGLKPDKPIAFLCNPPYRSDDDQAAESISYPIHPSIVDLTGVDGSSERYSCFLAQMKLICEKAESSGLPGNSLLLLFTKAAWLTDRPVFQKIRSNILGSFEDVGGLIVNGKEFFDVKGKFPIAFTIWRYNTSDKALDPSRPVNIIDLTWMKKQDLGNINWESPSIYNDSCERLLADKRSCIVAFGQKRDNIKTWSGQIRKDVQREWRKSEQKSEPCGLPLGDHRHERKKRIGEKDGTFIAFMDDLTPCRIKNETHSLPWFRLNNQFMDCRKTRCLSGPPSHVGYSAVDAKVAPKMFLWFALGRTFDSEGYPMWVDAMEMWGLDLSPTLVRIAYAIGFAENECVETIFPANNPVKGVPELLAPNPLSPNSKKSFWSTVMRPVFDHGTSTAHDLVAAVENLYKIWNKHLGNNHEIRVTYDRPYFIGKGKLTKNSGLIQIRDYAKEKNIAVLLTEFDKVQALLSKVKKEFHKMLMDKDGLNYFGQPKMAIEGRRPDAEKVKVGKSRFDKVLDFRLALSAKIVESLQDDVNFGRVKFAKVLYLAEKSADLDLKTEYYREAAGPLDQRALYNDKVGIEPLAAKRGLFTTKEKTVLVEGEKRRIVNYLPGKNLHKVSASFGNEVGDKSKEEEIMRVVKLVKPMTTDQIEIVATLHAAWNDLLMKSKGKKVQDEGIIKEFLERWHERKKRFSKDQLTKALAWMRKNRLVPTGKGKATLIKRDEEIDF